MLESLRDKSRDELTDGLKTLGIATEMPERGRSEEDIQRSWVTRSLGVINIQAGPVRWINVIEQDGNQYSGPRWWTVLGIPDERGFLTNGEVKVRTVRKKSFPLFGRAVSVQWAGEDHGTGIIRTLSGDRAVQELAKRLGDLEVRWHTEEFQGWTLQLDSRFEPTYQDWAAIEIIAEYFLSSS
jgi:hypothetical protein